MARGPTGGVSWTDRASRSRRASRPPLTCRQRTTPPSRPAIDGHARLLLAWTSAINLTAIREPAAVAVAHVVDSLTAVALMRERGISRFVDLGSGGGYPGIPLAAVVPAERALLLEPIASSRRSRQPWSGPKHSPRIRAIADAGRP